MSTPRGMGMGPAASSVLTGLFLALAPSLARACAVCGGGNPANRFAFFASTIVLSLIPLGMFVGAFLWLRSRLRERAREEFRERDADTVAAAPPPRTR